jgi:pimeloyl-ACP methyl ester carboxylesterase
VYSDAPHWTAGYRKAIEVFIPKLDYQTMTGVGHFLMMEKPAEFNRRVLAFLRAQGLLKP